MALVRKAGALLIVSAAVVFFGVFVGASVVVLPIMGSVGFVALAGIVLLWALPDLGTVPEKFIRKAFFVMLVVIFSVPTYYTFQVPGLPWISLRRVATFGLVVPFALAVAASSTVRRDLVERMGGSPALVFCARGFLVMLVISIFTSINPSQSMSGLADAILNWYVPFLALIFIARSQEDLLKILKLICVCAIFVSLAGIVENRIEHRFFIDAIPKSMLSSLMANNESFANLVNGSPYRNGLYRASSIFNVSLSFAQFEVLVIPLGLLFALHGEGFRERLLGIAVVFLGLGGIVASGGRGGYVSLLISCATFACMWIVRKRAVDRASLIPGMVTISAALFGPALVGLIIFWPRAHNLVLGGGAEASSNDDRLQQWTLGIPKILSNPFSGHGFNLGADIIGFNFIGGNGATIDSYLLSLCVETGLPSVAFFYCMILAPVRAGIVSYGVDLSQTGAIRGAISCSLIAFFVYSLVLSQKENHTLLFILLAISVTSGYLRKATHKESLH